MKTIKILPLVVLVSFWASCKKDVSQSVDEPDDSAALADLNLPATAYNYANPSLPGHFLLPPVNGADNTPANNPVTNDGATLGRVLFYDSTLSRTYTTACANCHVQAYSFTDEKVLSDGFEGGKTGRHSMSIINARYYQNGSFFWDERAATLEDQVVLPIQDDVEMGMTLTEVVSRLQATDHYPVLFEKAFGSKTIDETKVALALAQFVRSIVSADSKFDEGRAQVNDIRDPFPNYSNQENMGKNLFFGRATCATCHGTEAFIAPNARNNGLDLTNTDDAGKGAITGQANQAGLFKVPSLRNVALRPPYMHDGRFATLAEVLDHYSEGIQDNPNLSPPLRRQDGTVNELQLTNVEKTAIIAFLETLNDNSVTTDIKFSNPFK